MICERRQALDPRPPAIDIRTLARHGYQFAAATPVERKDADVSDLVAPHRAWTEGRATRTEPWR